MNNAKMKGALLMGMLAFAGITHAQTASSSNNSAASNLSSTNSSMNQGVQATVNQYGQKDTHARIDQQVPLSVVGYGSFSQSNCENAVGLGASTKIFSLIYSAPKHNTVCEDIVASDSFGREAQLAIQSRKPMQAEIQRSISVWESCQVNEATIAMCIRMDAIRYVDPQHPDLKNTMPWPHFQDEAIVMPGLNEPAGTTPSTPPPTGNETSQVKQPQSQSPKVAYANGNGLGPGVTGQRWYHSAEFH